MDEREDSDFTIMTGIKPDPDKAGYVGAPDFRRKLVLITVDITSSRKRMTWLFEQITPEGKTTVTQRYTFIPSMGPKGYTIENGDGSAVSCMDDVDDFLNTWGTQMLSPDKLHYLRKLMGLIIEA